MVKVLPVGTVHAIWSGLGTAPVLVVAAALCRHIPSFVEIAGVALIVAGVVVITLFGDAKAP